jgi:ABC-type transport system involved in multi-copper enzyme maturation permease subunit
LNNILFRLTLRDMRKVLNLRALLVWGTMSALGIFFFFATSGKTNLMKKDEVVFMAIFLPQIIFGAWAVLSIYFDLVSSDRQHNVLDCILCAGVPKTLIFCGKIITLAVASLALSLAYLLPVTAVIIALSGNMAHWVVLLQYLLPLWGYIMVYAALGAAISVLARSTKTALIVSLASGLILMPRFFMLVVNGLGTVFKWTQATKDAVSLISPGAMMYVLAEYAGTAEYTRTAIIFSSGVIAFLAIAFIAFCRQDELNYGE